MKSITGSWLFVFPINCIVFFSPWGIYNKMVPLTLTLTLPHCQEQDLVADPLTLKPIAFERSQRPQASSPFTQACSRPERRAVVTTVTTGHCEGEK